jgi:hypothetical protein
MAAACLGGSLETTGQNNGRATETTAGALSAVAADASAGNRRLPRSRPYNVAIRVASCNNCRESGKRLLIARLAGKMIVASVPHPGSLRSSTRP